MCCLFLALSIHHSWRSDSARTSISEKIETVSRCAPEKVAKINQVREENIIELKEKKQKLKRGPVVETVELAIVTPL